METKVSVTTTSASITASFGSSTTPIDEFVILARALAFDIASVNGARLLGQATVMFIPERADPIKSELHTLLPSPTQATFRPSSLPLYCLIVWMSATV